MAEKGGRKNQGEEEEEEGFRKMLEEKTEELQVHTKQSHVNMEHATET